MKAFLTIVAIAGLALVIFGGIAELEQLQLERQRVQAETETARANAAAITALSRALIAQTEASAVLVQAQALLFYAAAAAIGVLCIVVVALVVLVVRMTRRSAGPVYLPAADPRYAVPAGSSLIVWPGRQVETIQAQRREYVSTTR